MAIITNKTIFYHIPKTGGTWATKAIRYSMKHNDNRIFRRPETNYTEIDESNCWQHTLSGMFPLKKAHATQWGVKKKDKEGLFSFSFVRQPLEWYKSWWINKGYTAARLKKWRTFLLDFAFDPNFEKFVENVIAMFPGGALTTIYKCYLGMDGKDLDFVGRQENLREDLIKALKMAGEDFNEKLIRNLKRYNDSTSRNLHPEELIVNSKLRRKLNNREKWIFETFYNE